MNKITLIRATLELPRFIKRLVVIFIDMSLCALSIWLAYYLRLGEWISMSGDAKWSPKLATSLSILIAIPVFASQGVYRAIFRYSGWPALITIAKAMFIYGLLFFTIITAFGLDGVPRTLGLIQPMLLLLAMGISRWGARYWLGGAFQNRLRMSSIPKVFVYGAGDAGRQLVRALTNSQEMRVVGLLDDDASLHGQVLNGQVIYNPINLRELIQGLGVTHVLLALPSISRRRRNEILTLLSPYKVSVRTLPSLNDLAQGKVSVSDLQDLDIDDLLGRDPVQPNEKLLHQNTKGKVVLVTGAGGSIGSELCRQIIKAAPKKLLLIEFNEFSLYKIHLELLALGSSVELLPLLSSVCDQARMKEIMQTWFPDTVYHAAAYKHVPLVEHNPAEGVRNNVWGTLTCAAIAAEHHVKNFVLISTDKAVRPTNIMGASKRLAEMVLQALSDRHPSTCFSMVRFGNVLGSSGSVVPLFREQIKNGGPITVTHEDITRYFMTIPEAAQLVIQAGAMGGGGDVFVLDMGEPVKILDLAKRMVILSGLTVQDEENPMGDIELAITGLRPGEKLYEELLIGDNPELTQHPRIMKAHESYITWSDLNLKLDILNQAIIHNDVPTIRTLLQEVVNGYQMTGDVVDWVHLATKVKNEN